jgi:hypothetical protein
MNNQEITHNCIITIVKSITGFYLPFVLIVVLMCAQILFLKGENLFLQIQIVSALLFFNKNFF